MAPQLRSFGAASTPSATWSRHLGGLAPPPPHSKNPGYVPDANILAMSWNAGFKPTRFTCCCTVQVNLLRHPKLAVVKREHETGRNFQFWWCWTGRLSTTTTSHDVDASDHHRQTDRQTSGRLTSWKSQLFSYSSVVQWCACRVTRPLLHIS